MHLPLFGDEAFYSLESIQLAWGYSDIPPLTAALIYAGTWLFDVNAWGLRCIFIILGSCLPLLVLAWVKQCLPSPQVYYIALCGMLMPLCGLMGLFALPDVTLTLCYLLVVIFLVRACCFERWRDYVLLGCFLAVGWLSHYRWAMIYLCGVLFLLVTSTGRQQFFRYKFWISQCVGFLGLLPILIFNYQYDGVAWKFQFVDRQAWQIEWQTLLDVFIQAVLVSPILYGTLIIGLIGVWQNHKKNHTPQSDVLFSFGVGLWGFYWGLGLIADHERVRWHWLLPAFLVCLPALQQGLIWVTSQNQKIVKYYREFLVASIGLCSLIWIAMLVNASQPVSLNYFDLSRPFPDNLYGWQEFYDWSEDLANQFPKSVLIANYFMPAAQLSFAIQNKRDIYVLSHSLNVKHGRQSQIEIWKRDMQQLQSQDWQDGLLIVEETALSEIERLPYAQQVCAQFGSLQLQDTLSLFQGEMRFYAFTVTPRSSSQTDPVCMWPAMADFISPLNINIQQEKTVSIHGWAIQESIGIASVEILIDQQHSIDTIYGDDAYGVQQQWPMSQDPNHPKVGFHAQIDFTGYALGRHEISLRVTAKNQKPIILAQRYFWLTEEN